MRGGEWARTRWERIDRVFRRGVLLCEQFVFVTSKSLMGPNPNRSVTRIARRSDKQIERRVREMDSFIKMGSTEGGCGG